MTPVAFTPHSARRTLARLRPLAERIRRVYRELERRLPQPPEADGPVAADYFALLGAYAKLVARVEDEGVRVADPLDGTLDFPALRAGRPVWLCWSADEPTLGHWHELDDGGDRRPLDDGPWGAGVAPGGGTD